MEDLFEQNLLRQSSPSDVPQPEIIKPPQMHGDRHRIDLLDAGEDDDIDALEEPDNTAELEDSDNNIKRRLTQKKFENVFGLGLEDESQISSNMRKSREWFSKKSSHKIRTSIASKHFLKRENYASQNTSGCDVSGLFGKALSQVPLNEQ